MGERIKIAPVPKVLTVDETKVEIEVMRAAGINDTEIQSLAQLREKVMNGEVSDLTIEAKRAMFFKYLTDSGRIHD